MTVPYESKDDDVQKQLAQLSISDKKTNMVKLNHTPRHCAGKVTIELGDITQHNIQQIKKLNETVFPVTYNDRFYKEIVERSDYSKIAFFNDCVVGAVSCRLEIKDNERKLYIMTLGTLAPYRRFGIGGLLLNFVFSLCDKDPLINKIVLHVQINNESALNFYEHFGFERTREEEKYYKKIQPDSAYVLEKAVNNF
ncbi:N-alpha-acetyltransferase 50 [Aphelenchoides bicaudatus]|nr:N-alpha-acetyltransferase 50 [Aphelenchoides bicaudatus]